MMKPGLQRPARGSIKLIACLILSTCLVLTLPGVALGQKQNSVTIAAPDLSQFPVISTYFWPVDAAGEFIQNLQSADVTILENNRQVPVGSLEKIEPGVHFVVSVNEGPTLANRYAGVVRFDTIKQALSAWISAQPSTTTSDFSLIHNDGAVASNLASPADWLKTLTDYQPDLRAATPGMESLSTGIDTAGAVGNSTTKTKALLYITPLPQDVQLTGIQDAAARAAQLGVRLFIWLIGPQNYSATQGAMVLQKAAADTGGSFFVFSGAETLPEIASYLNPLRFVYHLSYTTHIQSSGDFNLALEVKSGGISLTSNTVPFSLKVLPPNPILLSPPITLHRTWITGADETSLTLSPVDTTIKILLEFPDGHQRSLTYTRLFVDGSLESENTTPPFDTFRWDLSPYTSSGTHTLKVTIQDAIGLTSQTIEVPVEVQVDAMPRTQLQKIQDWFTPLRAILVGVAAAALVVYLVILIRRRLASATKRKKLRRRNDLLTQEVEVPQEKFSPAPLPTTPESWPKGAGNAPARARLRLCDADTLQPLPGPGIALTKDSTVIGSDPHKASLVLTGESVSEVHAVLTRLETGEYALQDAGSISGTWVNYAPVPISTISNTNGAAASGVLLAHGDLIHIGRVPLVFELYKPVPVQFHIETLGNLE